MTKTHTFQTYEILLSEFQYYRYFDSEIEGSKFYHDKVLQELKDELYKIEQSLLKVKGPTIGDDLAGTKKELDEKYNDLITKKDEVLDKLRIQSEKIELNDNIIKDFKFRKRVVEEHLEMIENESDRNFMIDVFIKPIGYNKVMMKYGLNYDMEYKRKKDYIITNLLGPNRK